MSDAIQRKWKAAIYVRISKENGDDTLDNQRNTVAEYLRRLGNIEICGIKVDDGYSGLNCNRPAFQELLYDIQQEKIDCVAIRDLSRLSRNYIEAGRYIQQIFPSLGVRLISVFEGLDLVKAPEYNVSVMVSFRNIVNEEYSRNISCNIQSVLSKGRQEGKYLGAFAAYGYRKSSGSRYRLEPDPAAAEVVRNIFRWKLDGMSAASIAEQLEQTGVPSPAEYKKESNYHTSFQKNAKSKWSSASVGRILSNRIYTGRLEQGKSMKLFLKASKRVQKPCGKWDCKENAHDAIIPPPQFEAVARLLAMDTRCSPNQTIVPALAGFIRCKNCEQNMILQQVGAHRLHHHYVCRGNNPERKRCLGYRIAKSDLEAAVLQQMVHRIDEVEKICVIMASSDASSIVSIRKQEIIKELTQLSEEQELTISFQKALKEEFVAQRLTKSDFEYMNWHYTQKRDKIDKTIKSLEILALSNNLETEIFDWLEQYKLFFSFESITRPLLAYLVGRITVDRDKNVCVEFLHEKEYQFLKIAMERA